MDIVAKRYGKLPSEIAARSIEEYQFDLLVAKTGIETENRERNRLQRMQRHQRRGP